MKLINPKGRKVEVNDKKANKILSKPVKVKHGWKKATDKVNENSLKNLKPKKAKPVAKKATDKKK